MSNGNLRERYYFSAKDTTYGVGRSAVKARSFKSVVKPCQKVAFEIGNCVMFGLIETIVDRLQFIQGRNGIKSECDISWYL